MSSTKLISIFILLISFTAVAQAQTQRSTFEWNGNIFDVINPADITLNESLGLDLTPQELIDAMGYPDSVEDRHSELTGYDLTLYRYQNTYIYFHEEHLEQLDANSGNITFGYGGVNFKVGDLVGPLEELFPNSFNAHKEKNTFVVNLGYIDNVELKPSEIDLIIQYDVNDKIKRVMVMHRP